MLEYIVLGGGGNPRNTTEMPHPLIRILHTGNETVNFRVDRSQGQNKNDLSALS